jgi:hypothetical protein
MFVELRPHVAVQLIVKRFDLPPQPVHLAGKFIGRHVIA